MIIGVTGKAGAGKDVFAIESQKMFGAKIIPFAAGVKEEVAEFLTEYGIEFEYRNLWGSQEDKEEIVCVPAVGYYPDYFCRFLSVFAYLSCGHWYFTYRSLLQFHGTEYRREQDPDYWVKLAMHKAASYVGPVVISDTRFPNEAEAIRESGGVLVKIVRLGGPTISNMEHPSETALNDWEDWDYMIFNDGTLEEYQQKCRNTLSSIMETHYEQ